MAVSKNNLGIAGEYFVAAELSRRGFIASVTLKNTRGIDVLVASEDASKLIGIQVKTSRNKTKKGWLLGRKSETFDGDNLFYVFVSIPENSRRVEYYVIPSKRVAFEIKSRHKAWLEKPGKDGKPHADNPIRTFSLSDSDKANENWYLIEDRLK